MLMKNMAMKTKPETAATGSWKGIPIARIRTALPTQRE